MVFDPSNIDEFLDRLHHNLRTYRRRQVIELLSDEKQARFTVRELSKQIAAAEHDLSIEQATGEPYRNVYNSLSQTHLPALDSAGIVIYDHERQTVEPGPHHTIAVLLLAVSEPLIDVLQDAGNNSME